jgi:hypothetical protein
MIALQALRAIFLFAGIGARDRLIEPVQQAPDDSLQLVLGRRRDLLRRNTPVVKIFEERQIGRLHHREILASHEDCLIVEPLP